MKQNSTSLRNRDIPYLAKVAGWRTLEDDCVLALDDEAGDVEGSKIHPPVRVGRIIAGSREMVEPCRNVHRQMTVYQNL